MLDFHMFDLKTYSHFVYLQKVGRIILPFVEVAVVLGGIDVFILGVFEFSELVIWPVADVVLRVFIFVVAVLEFEDFVEFGNFDVIFVVIFEALVVNVVDKIVDVVPADIVYSQWYHYYVIDSL